MQPEHFQVRLRANNPPLVSEKPVTLTVDPTLECLLVADFIVPLRTLVVAPTSHPHELSLSSGRTRLVVRAASPSDPRWRQLADLLHRLQRSPNGYLIHAPIGRGAFGTVYRAHILQTGAPVALKAVRKAELRRHRWALAAARREQLILHALPPHPHVVSASHVFETRAALYTAMELVRGRELHAVLAERRGAALPPAVCVAVARQLLSAVAHLHAHGVVHRDIKLENIMLSDSPAGRPHVHLVDFGLAQTRDRAHPADHASAGSAGSAGSAASSVASPTSSAASRKRLSSAKPRDGLLDVVGTAYTQAPELVLQQQPQPQQQQRTAGMWGLLPWLLPQSRDDEDSSNNSNSNSNNRNDDDDNSNNNNNNNNGNNGNDDSSGNDNSNNNNRNIDLDAAPTPASDGEAAVDVWAVGIVLFCMLHGRIPWTEDEEQKRREADMRRMVRLAREAERGAYMCVLQSDHEREAVPAKLQSLLTGLLQPIAEKRLTARAALEHRALKVYDVAEQPTGKASLRRAARRMVAVLRTVEVLKAGIGSVA